MKQVFNITKNKEHLTLEGLIKTLSIRASMNQGFSEKLMVAFPNIKPAERPLVENQTIIDPHWLAGFTSAPSFY